MGELLSKAFAEFLRSSSKLLRSCGFLNKTKREVEKKLTSFHQKNVVQFMIKYRNSSVLHNFASYKNLTLGLNYCWFTHFLTSAVVVV